MSSKKYPRTVTIFKGEGRIFLVPVIRHIDGYSVDADWFIRIKDMDNSEEIGISILKAFEFINESPVSTRTSKERSESAAWKKNTIYKSWISFWKNNYCVDFDIFENGEYKLNLTERMKEHKGIYHGSIKKLFLPATCSVHEIGKAVLDIFNFADEYYHQASAYDFYPLKQLELLDGSNLMVKHPKDKHFTDYEDYGVGELYQCYCYLPKEDGESTAEFFVGIAPELDCNLDTSNIKSCWEKFYGKAEFFEVQEARYGMFKLRVEMRNKATHKISYLLQMEEDLILECGMDVHQPNRRKKMDEKLTALFEEFTLECKR